MEQPANRPEKSGFSVENAYQTFVDLNHDPALCLRDGRIIALNPALVALLQGTQSSQFLGSDVLEIIDPESRDSFLKQMKAAQSERMVASSSRISLRGVNGNLTHMVCRTSTVEIPGTGPVVLISLQKDTDAQHGIDDLQGTMVPLRTILETAMDGIVSINEKQEIVLFNAAAELIFGWKSEDVLGRSVDVLIPDQFRSRHQHDVELFGKGRVASRRMGEQRTVLALRSSGEQFPIEASISKTTNQHNTVYTVILRDVTEAVRYRQQIEEQSQMLDQVSDAMSVTDRNGHITFWNQAAVRLFGWSAEQAIGKNHRDLLYRGEGKLFEDMKEETNRRGSWVGELTKSTKEGKLMVVEHRRSVIRDSAGKLKGYLCIDIDITDRKKRDIIARRSQRLESIGTLAGGIAHDLNNVLSPVLIGAQVLASGRPVKNQKAILDTMIASAYRGTDLVKQVLAFAGGIHGERRPIEFEPLVKETHHLLEHTLPKSIRIETQVDATCPQVLGDPTEMSQILMNLCINARDAMPTGGTLAIQAEGTYINGNATQLNPDAKVGLYVLLKVSDTGSGMTPEVLDRIFDPFFTTKEIGKGTGLGLATVQGIVKSYSGFINVYSEPGRGTTFSVYFPAVVAEEVTRTPSIDTPDEPLEGEIILLVDDEDFILQMTSAALEAHGYQVIKAPDGAEALAIFAKRHKDISAVLLDMMMPGMDGIEVLDELLKIDPAVSVIACSGLRTSQRETDVKLHGAKDFLAKPYSEEQLLRALAAISKRPG